jgi:hypothetical protein
MRPRRSEAEGHTAPARILAGGEGRLPRPDHNAPVPSAVRMHPSVHLHIEEVVLHGFAPGDRRAIQETMQTELTTLLAERGLPKALTQSGERTRLDAGEFQLAAQVRAEVAGRQIARALYEGFRAATDFRPRVRPEGASP